MRSLIERRRYEFLRNCVAAELRRHQQQKLAIEFPSFMEACVSAIEADQSMQYSLKHVRSAIHTAMRSCDERLDKQTPRTFAKACCAMYIGFRELGIVLEPYADESDRIAEEREARLEAELSQGPGA